MHARGLRLRGVARRLAVAPAPVWPSDLLNSVGTPVAICVVEVRMPYRIAGIDVHKAMLAVVVADVEFEEDWQFARQSARRPANCAS